MRIVVGAHAVQRIKERVGIKSGKKMQLLAEAAYYEGQSIYETSGISLSLMEDRLRPSHPERDLRLYRDQIFVYEYDFLVTVLPKDLGYMKAMEKSRAKHNRQAKRAKKKLVA